MAKFIMYLIETSAVLAFFYLIYIFVLRRETFFSLNRFFLMGILVFSLLFPFLSFDFNLTSPLPVERPIEEISKFRLTYYEAMALWEFESYSGSGPAKALGYKGTMQATKIDSVKLLFIALIVVYAIGVIVCLSRIIWTLRWIRKMITTYPREEIDSTTVIKVPNPIAPFSFLKYIFVHSSMANMPEFDQILAHEKTHIRQKHSIDLIFVQLLAAFLWFNPVIWQLIKSLKTTHEYIADKKIINSGYSLVEYQTLLLRQLISNNSYGLVHNFNLSFIKKRITMMKNKKSGWPGKVKVTMAIICTAVFSAIIVQCNSKFEEPVSIGSEKVASNEFTEGINLPVLPERKDPVVLDLTDALNFTISENKLTINGEIYEIDEISEYIEKKNFSKPVTIVLRANKDQKMDFIRKVQMELRKADQRKILYLGQSLDGAKVETTLLLPPTPENAAKKGIPQQPDVLELEAEGKLEILKIDMGDNAGALNQQKVYDFVKSHMQKQSSDYVISARYTDDDTYDDYLMNLVFIKEGFNKIYQERMQEMFGKDFYDADKEEFQAVRKGIPMAISIAE